MNCELRNIVVVGRGAVGAVYCEAFAKAANVDLRVAADTERVDRYGRDQFTFNNKPLDLQYFTPLYGDRPADLIIITTKWEGYAAALDLIEPIVGEATIILPLLNGLMPYQMAEQRYGQKRALRGYYIGHTATRTANCASQDGAYRTVVGEAINTEGNYSERLQRLIDLFDRCAIKYRVDEQMESSRWLKFVINLGLNQTSIIDGGLNYGQIRASSEYGSLCQALMEEASTVAEKIGIVGAQQMAQKARKLLDTLPDADYSSMAQDIRASRPTEWPIFGEHLLKMAQELKLNLPAHNQIKEILTHYPTEQ